MNSPEKSEDNTDKLVIVWTSGDVYVAERMVFMYTHAAISKSFFKEVVLIIWGPSAKLAAENCKIQEKLKRMQQDGMLIQACITCAKEYGVDDKLKKMGFEVKAMGSAFTGYIRSNARVLTF
jgi:hypothetical protein